MTDHFVAPGAPDAFSFFLTNPSNTATVVSTTDPTGADALFLLEANGLPGGNLSVYTNSNTALNVSWSLRPRTQNTVPEPSAVAFALTGAGLLTGLGVLRRLRRR